MLLREYVGRVTDGLVWLPSGIDPAEVAHDPLVVLVQVSDAAAAMAATLTEERREA